MRAKLFLSPACLFILFQMQSFGISTHWAITDRIPLDGDSRWDYVTVEPETSRLFVAHDKQVVVIDLKTKKSIGSIAGNGVHGTALAPDLQRGFISNGADNRVMVFDLRTLKILSTIPVGEKPDAICYDPAAKRVFVFNGKSETATVIDATQDKVVGTIPLGGKPEFAVTDGHGSIFDAVEDKGEILKINAASLAIEARWNLPQGSGPSALAIDIAHHRLFIGCRNQTMVILDSSSGKSIATLPIGKGVDACCYDSKGQRAFASCGEGSMTVVEPNKDTYVVSEKTTTKLRARTMAFDSSTSTAYLPTTEDEKFEILVLTSK